VTDAVMPDDPVESLNIPTAEIERLRSLIRMLRSRIETTERLEIELQATWNENARLQTTVQVLKSELTDRVAEAERLKRSRRELITVRAERDLYEAEWRALSALVEQLRARLDELQPTTATRLSQEFETG
jgi:hypothetical protein